ncbi:ATP-binding protein [Lutibacter flavus]|uniref:histidine kinase n=1 Tax=Lutibacter flavus TaxID=691689 RepID=A0A238VN19_9FLAO|nr:ATP-binding protein [Lutibacter flavus]SNR35760.1 Signal transduction histidine kinase [Lutibacter flavus]
MKISHLIRRDFLTINPFYGLNAIKKELIERRALVVQDENKFYGVLTINDLVANPRVLVIDCLSIKKMVDCEQSVKEVLWEMKITNTDVLPVSEEGNLIGLVFRNELYNYVSEYNLELETIIQERTKELKKTLETKDLMFSIIAHDLRSPFSSILGLTDLLKRNLQSYDIEKTEKFINQMNIQAKKTYNLINNLLNWANNQSGKLAFNPSYCNIGKICDEVIDQLKETAQMKNITLKSFYPENSNASVDKNMVEVILRNLISNAIKFTENNGFVEVYLTENENFIEVTVSDTGIGVDKKNKTKIFTIDDNKTKLGTANEKGSGLGLVVCKDFVERHQGNIWVEDKKDKGSLFKFTLPVSKIRRKKLKTKNKPSNKVEY